MSAMAETKSLPIAKAYTSLVLLAILLHLLHPIDAQVGVCYGRYLGDNLPSVRDVVNLYRSKGIGAMRIYAPDEEILRAVQGTGIKLTVDIPNGDDIIYIGANPKEATRFVTRYVVPYAASIKYIVVGNEVPMNSPYAPWVGPAVQNVIDALNSVNLGRIKVSTAISTSFVKNTYSPSNGEFTNLDFIRPIVEILGRYDSPLMVNIYTFFAYADPSNTGQISLDYALFRSRKPVFTDPNNGLKYYNLFDAMVDSVYAALSKVNVNSVSGTNKSKVRVAGGETGWASNKGKWPKDGRVSPGRIGAEDAATMENAEAYYKNLINHVKQGTPLRPEPIEVFLFEMFDENRKPGDEVERHFGLFYPNMQPKYQINFKPAVDVM